jgi:hypothetical protein
LDEGERQGIDVALKALNSQMANEQQRAIAAHEQMILRARIENIGRPVEERQRIERLLHAAYPPSWWAGEIRRRIYSEFIRSVAPSALAVYRRFNPEKRTP